MEIHHRHVGCYENAKAEVYPLYDDDDDENESPSSSGVGTPNSTYYVESPIDDVVYDEEKKLDGTIAATTTTTATPTTIEEQLQQYSDNFLLLQERRPSFLTNDRQLFTRHVSLELLNPHHHSTLRKSSTSIAVFNLVATICGGGVLTVPLAFARAGIIPTTCLLLLSAIMTNFALYILCSCSRRTGGRSYGDVARYAFGNIAEIITTVLLFVMLIGMLVAYMVLVKGIWTPILLKLLPPLERFFEWKFGTGAAASTTTATAEEQQQQQQQDDTSTDDEFILMDEASDYILIVILLCVSPLLLKRDLHALRHTCYVGFTSLIILTMGITYRCYEKNILLEPGVFGLKAKWMADNWSDVIFAFPITALSFFCSYNVLSAHGSLVNPTRRRMKNVLDWSIGLCLIIFFIFGICGYLYSYNDTLDNILLNFPLSDPIVIFGRIGYAFTLTFGMPLITLPCREALLSIPEQIRTWRADKEMQKKYLAMSELKGDNGHDQEGGGGGGKVVINGVNFDEERPILRGDRPKHSDSIMSNYSEATSIPFAPEAAPLKRLLLTQDSIMSDFSYDSIPSTKRLERRASSLAPVAEHAPSHDPVVPTAGSSSTGASSLTADAGGHDELRDPTFGEYITHYTSTGIIIAISYVLGVSVPGVAIVWSICGSSLALTIGFAIPSACYLKIRSKKKVNPRMISAWTMLVVSVIAAFVCTSQAVASIGQAPSR